MNQAQINQLAYLVEKTATCTGSRKEAFRLRLQVYCDQLGVSVPVIQDLALSAMEKEAMIPGVEKVTIPPGNKAVSFESKKVPIGSAPVRSLGVARCEQCHVEFERKTPKTRFCSAVCRVKYHRHN